MQLVHPRTCTARAPTHLCSSRTHALMHQLRVLLCISCVCPCASAVCAPVHQLCVLLCISCAIRGGCDMSHELTAGRRPDAATHATQPAHLSCSTQTLQHIPSSPQTCLAAPRRCQHMLHSPHSCRASPRRCNTLHSPHTCRAANYHQPWITFELIYS